MEWEPFWLGLLGIVLVVIGVELFNEYFDAKEGGDRIFLSDSRLVPHHFFWLGLLVFLVAFMIGLYLSFRIGWWIMLFSILGFFSAYFYVGPPIRWAYRGLGELVIALSYGPFMILGSYYLQIQRLDILPLWLSLIFGLLIFAVALLNEIPDYYQDRLVGKRNLVVRFGRKKSLRFYKLALLLVFLLLGVGVFLKIIPYFLILGFLGLPLVVESIQVAERHYETPQSFIPAIRGTLLTYVVFVFLIGLGLILPELKF